MVSSEQVIRPDGPLLLFGGPYSNLEATRALLDRAAALGIPPRRIVCTGDIVAYGADPAATVELVKTGADAIIAGHCGLPFTQKVAHRLWHNAGAIGLPANDGTPRTWYSVLSIAHGNIIIEHCA